MFPYVVRLRAFASTALDPEMAHEDADGAGALLSAPGLPSPKSPNGRW